MTHFVDVFSNNWWRFGKRHCLRDTLFLMVEEGRRSHHIKELYTFLLTCITKFFGCISHEVLLPKLNFNPSKQILAQSQQQKHVKKV